MVAMNAAGLVHSIVGHVSKTFGTKFVLAVLIINNCFNMKISQFTVLHAHNTCGPDLNRDALSQGEIAVHLLDLCMHSL